MENNRYDWSMDGGHMEGSMEAGLGAEGMVPLGVMGGAGMSHQALASSPPAKVTRRGEGPRVELRFLIASKVAGVIIGRGGQSIKKLREDFAARISIPDSNGNGAERIMALEGDLASVLAMLADILPRMDESLDLGYAGRMDGGGMDVPSADLRLLVHQSQVGAIIGRGGFNIRELRESLPLRLLKVHPSVCPASTDRVVQMVGPPEVVLQCVRRLADMLDASPAKGARNNYTARANFPDFDPSEYGGFAGGRDDVGGGGAVGGRATGGLASPPMHADCMQGPMGDFGGNAFPGAGDRTSTQVSLPDKLTGSIMGRGGARINQIRQQSGAEITINPQDPTSCDRIITIRGSTEQIQKAQFLMQLCVKRFSGHY